MIDMKKETDKILEYLDDQEQVRERLLDVSRSAIRKSSSAMAAFHRGDEGDYEEKLEDVKEDIESLNDIVNDTPYFSHHGSLIAAHREFSEAVLTRALIEGGDFPDPEDLNVSYRAFAQALAESIGELRRHVLNLLRDGELEKAQEVHERMEDVFHELVQFDYPDSILSGMRRKRDGARKSLEKTRADVTRAVRERKLEEAFKETEKRLDMDEV